MRNTATSRIAELLGAQPVTVQPAAARGGRSGDTRDTGVDAFRR